MTEENTGGLNYEVYAGQLSIRLEKAQEEIARLRTVLKRIREWPYDIMGDCVYDARKEAEEALKVTL
jgi:hypothetical protein